MSVFDFFRRKSQEQKAAQIASKPLAVLTQQTANVPVYSDMTVRKATREGYRISIYVYRCVRAIIQACSGVPWIVMDDPEGEKIPNHSLARVLKNPNPHFSGQDMMELLIGHRELVGNALWQPLIVGNEIREFWPVMPDMVQPIPSDNPEEWLAGWWVTDQQGKQNKKPADMFVHFMELDPGNLYWGTSPLMAAARTVDCDNEAQDTQKVSMQNRGVTDGAFVHEEPMTEDQFEEARLQMKEQFLHRSRRREPWILGAGTKWVQMSMTPLEMDYIASRLANKQDIAAAFGLDPWWVGDRSSSTYNNVREARQGLYEDVGIPLLDDIRSTMNLKLAPYYDNKIYITYDLSGIPALKANMTEKADQAKTFWAMGVPFDQINAKLELGFEEFAGWDRGYLPFSVSPVGESGQVEMTQSATATEPVKSYKNMTPADWEAEYANGVPHWAEDKTPSLFAQEFLEEMLTKKFKQVLEIGCGNGRDSILFARAGMDTTGIDVTNGAIALTKQNAQDAGIIVDFQVGNAEEMTFGNNSFDAVFSLSVLHSSDLKKSIPEIRRVVRKKGLVFIYLYGDTQYADGKREEIISVDDYLTLIKSSSFEVLDFYSEQENEFDEFGEKHLLLVGLMEAV